MGTRLIHDELEKQAHWRPDKLAMAFEGTEYTYRALDARVNRTVRALAELGVRTGDRVLAHGYDHVDWHTLFYACSKLGATYCPVSTFQSPDNLSYIAGELDPVLVCYTVNDDVRERVDVIDEAVADTRYVSLDPETDDPWLDDLVTGYDGSRPAGPDERDPDRIHNVFWTSGTTGRPKGVLRDHRSSLHFADNLINDLPFHEWNTRVTTNSMMLIDAYFHYGIPTVMAGGTNVMLREFSPEALYEAHETYDVNSLHLGFTLARLVLEHLSEHDRTLDLRYLSAVIPSANIARELWALTDQLHHLYGTTETGLPLVKRLEPPFDERPSLGKPGMGAQIRVVPQGEDGIPTAPLEPGTVGELACRGETTMTRYMDPEIQAEKVQNGWIRPGDVVRVTEQRDIVFLGRTDDRIRSGGVNVYPGDVENVLEEHAAVENAIVVGVDDETWGERVCALAITAEQDADDLADALDEHCREHDGVAREMRPKEYAFVASNGAVPMGSLGKPDRDRIAEEFFDRGR
jgi:acyl-CoA synthetase (AMP-forming)/AMP-acid ligase II